MAEDLGPGPEMVEVVALLPGAGTGERLGGVAKTLLQIGGRSLLAHVLDVLEEEGEVNAVVVAAPPSRLEEVKAEVARLESDLPVLVCAGGARRQDSVRLALEAAPPCRLVLVHDVARPMLTPEVVGRVLAAARRTGAATAAIRARDTVKRVGEEGLVDATLRRETLRLIQTPQAFATDLLRRAHLNAAVAGQTVDDDAELVELLGSPVEVVEGDARNLKITTAADLGLAEAWLG